MAEIKSMRDNLRTHQATVLENLDLLSMLSYCVSEKIITAQTEAEIECKTTPHDQNFKFLSVVQDLPDDKFCRVIHGLADVERDQAQAHLGCLITGT